MIYVLSKYEKNWPEYFMHLQLRSIPYKYEIITAG